jgi:hypothetical protein
MMIHPSFSSFEDIPRLTAHLIPFGVSSPSCTPSPASNSTHASGPSSRPSLLCYLSTSSLPTGDIHNDDPRHFQNVFKTCDARLAMYKDHCNSQEGDMACHSGSFPFLCSLNETLLCHSETVIGECRIGNTQTVWYVLRPRNAKLPMAPTASVRNLLLVPSRGLCGHTSGKTTFTNLPRLDTVGLSMAC